MVEASDRVAVVVGGASGIGAAIVTGFADAGWRTLATDLPGTGAVPVDVTDEESVAALLDGVVAEHGRVDVVVNSAGVSTLGNVVDLAVEEWRRVVDVCLTGAFVVIKHAGQRLGPGGSVISLSSLNARQPGAGLAAYCAAKAGLSMLTEVAALELAPRGIRVNAIAPGLVVTPLTAPAMDIPGIEDDYLENTPLGRSGRPEEIAEAALYLATAGWVTGEVLDINGGAHLMRYPDLNKHVLAAFG
ncbi:SDR family NAD(P)-dependent oxidoreductase [Nocardioides sp.]|uniref:SDR family NAD(P)-dependent oxidoreductase n=1 Tax=Nocardioides sp. TaxID=35761 RepID=UPI0037831505